MKFFNKLRAKFHGVPYRINDFFYNYVIMERMPDNADILVRLADGSIRRCDEELPELLVTHWMEIPKLQKNG